MAYPVSRSLGVDREASRAGVLVAPLLRHPVPAGGAHDLGKQPGGAHGLADLGICA